MVRAEREQSRYEVKICHLFFPLLLSLVVLAFGTSSPLGTVISVRDFGAIGDGKTLDTPAINRCIQATSNAGGGTVFFPPGTYLSGSIQLKSNITLYLDNGSTILAAPNAVAPYDSAEANPYDAYQDFGHSHWHNSLICGVGLEHLAILGQGTINGSGMTTDNKAPECGGDKSIALKLCKNVDIRDVTMIYGGHFAILLTGCDNVTIDNLRIDTNRDGMDIDCCRNVRISNCSVNSPHDDGICLKSSYALGYKRATEDVTITNCMLSGYDEGSMVDGTFKGGGGCGRIKCGTESNGGFKNITISNCAFDRCTGLVLAEVDGGIMDGITVSNIVMRDCSSSPVFIRLGDRARGPNNPPPGEVKNIEISGVTVIGCNPASACMIIGIPEHDIEDVRLSNIRIMTYGGATRQQASIIPPEDAKGYPDPWNFGTMPAYGFFCRHVKGIEFHNIDLSFAKPDMRPAFVLENIAGAELSFIKAERESAGLPTFQLRHVDDFTLDNSLGMKPVHGDFGSETRF